MGEKKEETMNENRTTTYGDLKNRKAELRAELRRSDWLSKPAIDRLNDMEELRQVSQAIKKEELFLLYSISPDESYGELPEQARQKKCRTGALICFVIAVFAAVLLIVGLLGCHTVNGVGRDLSAWSSPYIEHQENK